ncbi:hypothetical protein [Kibdelosporangium philippinense]|uniref:hypothetical protein n=1 Tax=Kibdelosporangium philippinense TaxID=211113 RepID=UPI00361B1928
MPRSPDRPPCPDDPKDPERPTRQQVGGMLAPISRIARREINQTQHKIIPGSHETPGLTCLYQVVSLSA